MSRYKIWDKKEDILTRTGKKYTAQEWLELYPIGKYVDMVIGGGVINGSYWIVYEELKDSWKRKGLDFSKCKSKQEVLDMIEEAEDKEVSTDINYQEEMMYALQDIAINLMPQ